MTLSNPPAFTAAQIDFLCQSLYSELTDAIVIDCLAIDQARFIIVFQKNSEKKLLFFCLEKPFIRFHLLTLFPIPFKQLSPHSLYPFIDQAQLKSIQVINKDRILALTFSVNKKKMQLVIEFFPKHPNYYLLDDHSHILLSLHPSKNDTYVFPPERQRQQEIGPLLSHEELEKIYSQQEKEFLFQTNKNEVLVIIKQELKKIEKKKHQLQQQLAECLEWEHWQHQGELLKAHFGQIKKGMRQLLVFDWLENKERMLLLDPTKAPSEQVSDLFRKSKKLQKGIVHLQKQLHQLEDRFSNVHTQLETAEIASNPIQLQPIREHWIKSHYNKTQVFKEKAALPYQEYLSSTGMRIWVGKSAKNNEILTFKLANGSDWWLHVRDYPGSHIVIKTIKGQQPDQETLQDAMQLAIYYSKAKNHGSAEVSITQRKFISRLKKGQTGQVQISKHTNIFTKIDPERYQLLKERQKTYQ